MKTHFQEWGSCLRWLNVAHNDALNYADWNSRKPKWQAECERADDLVDCLDRIRNLLQVRRCDMEGLSRWCESEASQQLCPTCRAPVGDLPRKPER
jgi:hypothetical protein